jgi:UDP-N-acetylmuramyl pentapeptide phosphotransferase/UDP-N-acetylglucosamine-1-phosphate transferase
VAIKACGGLSITAPTSLSFFSWEQTSMAFFVGISKFLWLYLVSPIRRSTLGYDKLYTVKKVYKKFIAQIIRSSTKYPQDHSRAMPD